MYRLTKGIFHRDAFVLPYNDTVPSDYCFLNVLSESGDAKSLRKAVIAQGATPVGKVRSDKPANKWPSREEVMIARYLVTTGETTRWHDKALVAYAWVKVPDQSRWLNNALPLRAEIAPMSDEQADYFRCGGSEYEIGVASSYGELRDDDCGNGPVIISGWDFYHVLPLLGYTWQSYLVQNGHDASDEAAIEPYGFDDDSDVCSECMQLDSRDNGYTYNFRETPSGEFVGVNCGCYDEACRDEYLENVNEHDKCITLELARELAREGKLAFVARYIGGWTDPGRGGFFRCDDDAVAGENCRCENGDPEDVLKALLAAEPEGQFIFSHDESGQFQTYWSAWRVIEDESEAAA